MRHTVHYIILVAFSLALAACGSDGGGAVKPIIPVAGADISFLAELESKGAVFKENGVARSLPEILKRHGLTWIRLRLWHDPSAHGGWCNLGGTLSMAARIKNLGFSFLLDIHYSDWWADPGKQNKPAAWSPLGGTTLSNTLFQYTRDTISAFVAAGAAPDMVQIGNEITPGMLWEDGRISGFSNYLDYPVIRGSWDGWTGSVSCVPISNNIWQATLTNVHSGDQFKIVSSGGNGTWWGDGNGDQLLDLTNGTAGNIILPSDGPVILHIDDLQMSYSYRTVASEEPWERLASFLKAGVAGVHAIATNIRIMLHLHSGDNNALCRTWFDAAVSHGVPFDVIGLSYYPHWNTKDLQVVYNNLADLAARYERDVMIVETSYPWTLGWNDNQNNIVGTSNQLIPAYPATPEGQKAYLSALVNIMRTIPGGRGLGIMWWEPDYIAWTNFNSSQENLTWFDFKGNLLPTVDAFTGK